MASRFLLANVLHRRGNKISNWTLGACCYHMDVGSAELGSDARVIDMRSDVLTKPNKRMRQAMADAVVGDDVFREDPMIHEIQAKVANMFGMEAALFVPSGTMGNLVAMMAHCSNRGDEVILGDKSHLFLFEQGGIAQVAGVHPMPVINRNDGTFSIKELKSKIRPTDDPHQTLTRVVSIENTHNFCGGRVLPLSFIEEVAEVSHEHGLIVHMDGARLMNAAYALDRPPLDLVKKCDSVSMCLSKGLGAPVGSMLAGTTEFIEKTIRCRKVLGGGMRQPGILAAAGLVALSEADMRMAHDHEIASKFAKGIAKIGGSVIEVDVPAVESNIIMLHVVKEGLTSEMFCQRLREYACGR
ncbi:PREDICTED: probable low-specificity L-threonine aldolase 2 isoform X2 [Priapulus caudatus]|uniref:Probable low-specificity L-threonine aldolase 2 isoform X2 n=1 Tax=Priapulus caudatus TaxID=37621 RepID=A0ABM1E2R9_PRICU|nr:PREDICTED: probable low-specificity L-threonine aldolase 2 isoform X2 [Priapulus caudatus]